MRKWEAVFTDADRELVKKGAFAAKQSFGKRPAFLIVDVTRSFIGSQPKPVLESVEEYKTSCGESGWTALEHIRKLLTAFRSKKVPPIFTTNDPVTMHFAWGPTKRPPAPLDRLDAASWEIAREIEPLPSELVIRKTKASAFFGTSLVPALQNLKVDCLLIGGTTTSGCVRASVVDAFSYQYPCFVVEECTFDRFELSHLVNLWDMNAKYADVITLAEALDYIESLP